MQVSVTIKYEAAEFQLLRAELEDHEEHLRIRAKAHTPGRADAIALTRRAERIRKLREQLG